VDAVGVPQRTLGQPQPHPLVGDRRAHRHHAYEIQEE
jgi:hypothetical protein